jgi:propane monooxygenase coupling protein
MNNQVGVVVADVMDRQDNVTVTHLPSMIRVDCVGRMDFVYDEISEALGEEEGFYNASEFEENMSTHYGKMIHMDDRTVMFFFFREPSRLAAEFIGRPCSRPRSSADESAVPPSVARANPACGGGRAGSTRRPTPAQKTISFPGGPVAKDLKFRTESPRPAQRRVSTSGRSGEVHPGPEGPQRHPGDDHTGTPPRSPTTG